MEIPTSYLVTFRSLEGQVTYHKIQLSDEMAGTLIRGLWRVSETLCLKLMELIETDCIPRTQCNKPQEMVSYLHTAYQSFEIDALEVKRALAKIYREARDRSIWYCSDLPSKRDESMCSSQKESVCTGTTAGKTETPCSLDGLAEPQRLPPSIYCCARRHGKGTRTHSRGH